MKVLVTGGRDFTDFQMLSDVLDDIDKTSQFKVLIHGDAKGVDRAAGAWARVNGTQEVKCPANWDFYGKKAAGPVRNRHMLLLQPDFVVAFPGGTGTADMCAAAKKNNIKVWRTTDELTFTQFFVTHSLRGW